MPRHGSDALQENFLHIWPHKPAVGGAINQHFHPNIDFTNDTTSPVVFRSPLMHDTLRTSG